MGRLLDRLQQLDDDHLWRLGSPPPGQFRSRVFGGLLTFAALMVVESVLRGWGLPDPRGIGLLVLVGLPMGVAIGRAVIAVLWRVAILVALAAVLLAVDVPAWLVAPSAVVGVVVWLVRADIGRDATDPQVANPLENRPDVISIMITPPDA